METQIRIIREDIGNIQLLLVAIERQPDYKETDRLIQDAQDSLMKTEMGMIQLESQLSREPAISRQIKSVRVEQLKTDFLLTKNSLQTMSGRHDCRRKRAREKEELLTRRFTKNGETRVNVGMDSELNVNDHLKYSNNMVDQLLARCASVHGELQNQKLNLLNIRRQFHFLTKSLGISDITIQLIHKRAREDIFIFFVGVFFCSIFMFVFYYLWHF